MTYSGPGLQEELHGEVLAQWQTTVSKMFDIGVAVAQQEHGSFIDKAWFFNALKEGIEDGQTEDILWSAFPRRLQIAFPDNGPERWGRADNNRVFQEEYCEWEVTRSGSEMTSVVFTTETPDYYEFLAQTDRELLLDLYEKFVGVRPEFSDLVQNGRYNDLNKWNVSEGKGTIVHMGANPANTLGAAINLSAEASWPSVDATGAPITAEQALIACRNFGEKVRHSDPHIGAKINALVRGKNRVSFPGPVGLYIDSLDLSGFEMPDGQDPLELVDWQRGADGYRMRLKIGVPNGASYKLSDVLVDDEPLEFGGQIAEKIRIRIRGMAIQTLENAPEIACDNAQSLVSGMIMSRRMLAPN